MTTERPAHEVLAEAATALAGAGDMFAMPAPEWEQKADDLAAQLRAMDAALMALADSWRNEAAWARSGGHEQRADALCKAFNELELALGGQPLPMNSGPLAEDYEAALEWMAGNYGRYTIPEMLTGVRNRALERARERAANAAAKGGETP